MHGNAIFSPIRGVGRTPYAGSTTVFFNTLSAGTVFRHVRRQILTSKDGPRAERVK